MAQQRQQPPKLETLPLRDVLTALLRESKKPLKAKELASQAAGAGLQDQEQDVRRCDLDDAGPDEECRECSWRGLPTEAESIEGEVAYQSQKINERYAASLATVEEARPLGQLLEGITQRTQAKGRSVRALNPLAERDAALLEAVSRGEFLIHGFRNRDLCAILYGPAEKCEQRKQAGKITRLLGILRAHSLIAKVPKTHRYQLTEKGRTSISALLAARHANVKKLLEAA